MTLTEYIKAQIRTKLNEITDDTINGSCVTFDQYRYQCGIAFGLVMAEEIIRDAEKKASHPDSDDLTE